MLNKNRLLTGVVFPLMSIAIAAQPAAAMPFRSGTEAPHARSAVSGETLGQIILAQADPAAPAAEGAPAADEVPPPKKRRPAEEPAAEAPAPEPRGEEQRAPEPRPEAAPQAEPEAKPRAERPRNAEPEQRAAPAEAQPEPQAERPKRQREQPQDNAEEPKPERPARAQKPQGDGEAKPERPRRQEPAASETQAPVEPKAPAAKGQPEQKPARRPAEKPAEDTAPAKGAAPAEAVPEKKPEAPAPEPKAAPVPSESPAPEKPPAPEAQPNPAPGQQPSEQQRPPRGQSGEQAPVPNAPPPAADGATTGQAPAGEPVPAQIAVPQQEAPPSTKEELDKARAVAKDPSKSADTVILPIDKGAAVLDSDKEAERSGNQQSREQRRQEREAVKDFKVPTSDAESQAVRGRDAPQITIQAITTVQGERVDRRPDYDRPEGVREWQPRDMPRGGPRDRDMGDRVFLQYGDRVVVRGDDNERFVRDGAEPYYERLPEGRVRETVERRDGTQVVTIRNRYGDVIQRSRIDDRGREYVLFYAPELVDEPDREYVYRDPGLDLPPMRLRIPVQDYIIDTSSDPDRDYYRFLEQPPVEPVERVYSMDEVRYSARIRDKVRRIDLDTITFATGSAEIPMSQAQSLRKVADAMNKALQKNPAETFLIEGHTDAVGSDESNLVLSDERAASVANVLTDVYGIPPENFATQGYGERFLKVQTLGASQENRRVTIRRITPLVKPVAQK
jgi:outer membrane protein OmpA-like peptidoglycan-associated protein